MSLVHDRGRGESTTDTWLDPDGALTGIGRTTRSPSLNRALYPGVVSRTAKSEVKGIGEKQCLRTWRERLHSLRVARAALVLQSQSVWPRTERTWPSHTLKVPMRPRRSSGRLNAPAEGRSQFRRTPPTLAPADQRADKPS